jgi:hypothetical protein
MFKFASGPQAFFRSPARTLVYLLLVGSTSLVFGCVPIEGIPDDPIEIPSPQVTPPVIQVDGSSGSTPLPPAADRPDLPQDCVLFTGYITPSLGFVFCYPLESIISTGDTNELRIDLPFQAGTNLREKYLQINYPGASMECASPLAAGYQPGSLNEEARSINGVDFTVQSAAEGAAGSVYEWESYATTQDEACLVLTFVFVSTNPGNVSPPLAEYDPQTERAVIADLLSTFSWLE